MEGTVKFWKGTWGIVTTDEGQDAFVYHDQIRGMEGWRELARFQRVTFDLVETAKGRAAQNVVPLVLTLEEGEGRRRQFAAEELNR